MISIEVLKSKWEILSKQTLNKLQTLRIDPESRVDMYAGVRDDATRCLVLKLPFGYVPDFQSSVKQYLSLELFSETGWVILTLLDIRFSDLFNDLIYSIYSRIYLLKDANLYMAQFLSTYYKWSEFFQDSTTGRLSEKEVIGLFGELLILKDKSEKAEALLLNNVLQSWRGPYNTGHDFIEEYSNTEVKTRLSDTATVTISSEYQLQPEEHKELSFVIVTIRQEPLNGLSLEDLVHKIRNAVTSKLADYSIFLKTLSEKGLGHHNLNEYNIYRYIPVSIIAYDCMNNSFPALVKSQLPESISALKYKLNVESLSTWILSKTPV